jgi:hypothetical protein
MNLNEKTSVVLGQMLRLVLALDKGGVRGSNP